MSERTDREIDMQVIISNLPQEVTTEMLLQEIQDDIFKLLI